jgi:hypothetical protein
MLLGPRHRYIYIDDIGQICSIATTEQFAQLAGLQPVVRGGPPIHPQPRNLKPRHIKLVATQKAPDGTKFRTDIIVNERDPSVFASKLFTVHGIEMRCYRYVGEQRPPR